LWIPLCAELVKAVAGIVLLSTLVALAAFSAPNRELSTAERETFVFTTKNRFDYSPVFLGNGYLSVATTWNGTSPAPTTIAGLYDELEDVGYSYQALLPSWNGIDYWNGGRWLNSVSRDDPGIQGYTQTLNMYDGVLETSYRWIDLGRVTHVRVTSLVDRVRKELAAVRFEFTPEYDVQVGPVTVSFPLASDADFSYVWEGARIPGSLPVVSAGGDAGRARLWAIAETRNGAHRVGIAQAVELAKNLPYPHVAIRTVTRGERPALNVKFIVQRGETYVFTKLVAVAPTGTSTPEPAEALRALEQASARGFDELLEEHRTAWNRLWETDIIVRGDAEVQRALHAAQFYLLQALREDVEWSLPAVALPSRAYLGRIWWDADTWVLPALSVLHPRLARSIVRYRCRMLSGAGKNARANGLAGAQFPMQSSDSGLEAAPEWSSEIHVSSDVALAQWRFYLITGDLDYLRTCGYPVIRGAAEFWTSRVQWNAEAQRYECRRLTGPNESIVLVDNDSYTNAAAKQTLEVAIRASEIVGETPDSRWTEIAQKLYIPFNEETQSHPEFAADAAGEYSHQLILLTYPLGIVDSDTVKRNDLESCLRKFGTPGYEVGMLANFYSIVAAELGDRDLAHRLLLTMIRNYAKPPFYAMSETPYDNRFVFLTAEGAFLQQFVFGFTGLRFTENGLEAKFKPVLPESWDSLELRNLLVRGKRYSIIVDRHETLQFLPSP
jgi:trehalose/maltose hydrolase-like predicted phosphorylase